MISLDVDTIISHGKLTLFLLKPSNVSVEVSPIIEGTNAQETDETVCVRKAVDDRGTRISISEPFGRTNEWRITQ